MYKIKLSEIGSRFSTVKMDSEHTVNFYINNYDKIPVNKVVYDFFNSGELFINYPPHMGEITALSETIQTIYRNYIMKDSFMKQLDPDAGQIPKWTQRYVDDRLNGWILDLSLIFTVAPVSIPVPVCKNFTGATKDGSIHISSGYLFANKPSAVESNCSSPKVYVNKLTPHHCVYSNPSNSTYSFPSCPFYEYDYELIKSVEVNPNTSKAQTLEIRYIKLSDGFATYQLFDRTSSQINYVIYEKDTQELKDGIVSVMDEILTSYEDHVLKPNQKQEESLDSFQKKSYILSLV
jgi:hypothetical protein